MNGSEPNIPEGHITLKEASRISGYAPDYVGQLIRKGKLYGKQIYANVAWVTTEEAIKEYMGKGSEGDAKSEGGSWWGKARNSILSEVRVLKAVEMLLYAVIALLFVFILFLFYVFSVNFDRYLSESGNRSEEAESL